MKARLESAVIRGLNTSWYRAGDTQKPILLFLHGYPDSPETWESQLDHFKNDFEVVCPFLRGAGPSEKAGTIRRYGLAGVGLDLLTMLKRIDPKSSRPVYCVGHDLGAVHAAHLAQLLGSRMQGLILLNGLPLSQMARRFTNPKQHLKSWYIYLMQLPFFPETVAKHFPKVILGLAHELAHLPKAQQVPTHKLRGAIVHTVNQYRAFARELPRHWRQSEPRIHCPLLVIWGEDDAFLVTPTADEFKPFAHQITSRIIEGNHWVHRESPKRVNRLIGEFIQKTSQRTVEGEANA